jgi:hypothetical protein
MVDAHVEFNKRLRKIGRKHQAMERGYTTKLRSDGLIVAQPVRPRMQVPVKGIALLLIAFFGFKGFLLATLGPTTYDDRLANLRDGTYVEKVGAWAMQPDGATRFIAGHLGPILR